MLLRKDLHRPAFLKNKLTKQPTQRQTDQLRLLQLLWWGHAKTGRDCKMPGGLRLLTEKKHDNLPTSYQALKIAQRKKGKEEGKREEEKGR